MSELEVQVVLYIKLKKKKEKKKREIFLRCVIDGWMKKGDIMVFTVHSFTG